MRISDWSSDVCSSDLPPARLLESRGRAVRLGSGALALAPQEKCLVVMGGQDVPGFSGSGITPVDREQHVVHGLGVAVREAPAVAPVLGANGRRGDRVDEFAGRDETGAGGDRKSVWEGKSVSVRGALGGARLHKKKNRQ